MYMKIYSCSNILERKTPAIEDIYKITSLSLLYTESKGWTEETFETSCWYEINVSCCRLNSVFENKIVFY